MLRLYRGSSDFDGLIIVLRYMMEEEPFDWGRDTWTPKDEISDRNEVAELARNVRRKGFYNTLSPRQTHFLRQDLPRCYAVKS